MWKLNITGTVLVAAALFIVTVHCTDTGIRNKNVDRTIDLTSQNVKIFYKITLDHKAKKPITSYDFVMSQADREKLAFISIRDSAKKELKYTEEKGPKGVTFAVNLPAAAAANGAAQVLYIETVETKQLSPYPTEIDQSERQLVKYDGTAHFYSPYTTLTQKTSVHLSSKNVESFTAVKPSAQADTTITYGPYDNVAGNYKKKIVSSFTANLNVMTIHRIFARTNYHSLRE